MFQESIATQESTRHIINAKSLRLRQAVRSQAVSFLPSNCLFACVICEVMLSFLKKNDLKMSESHIATSRAVGQHRHTDASFLLGCSSCELFPLKSHHFRQLGCRKGLLLFSETGNQFNCVGQLISS